VDFVLVAGGGITVGLALGWSFSLLVARIDDHLVETTLTTVLAFGSFLVAEEFLHVSGVLAVVTAGLVAGNIGPQSMSPTTRIVVDNFWEYTAYLTNSVVFLLIGFQIDLGEVIDNLPAIMWAIAAVLVSRAIVIYLGSGLQGGIPIRWRHVLFWGGLRGGIALALALSLPFTLGTARDDVIAMAFGVVLFTLVAQGITMGWLIERLRIVFRSVGQLEYERRHARALAARAGYDHLRELRDIGLISSHTWDNIRDILKKRVDRLTESVQDALHEAPELEIDELINARRRELHAQRGMLGDLRHEGVISDEAHAELVVEVDIALETGVEVWAQRILADHLTLHIHEIIFVIIAAKDLENVTSSLGTQGISATQIASSGGFLRKKNYTLVLGIPEGKLDLAIQTIQRSTRGNIEYLEESLDEVTMIAGPGIPVHVRGATVFVFHIDAFEEIIS
jgi:CPA1 family monovalent cation:H+ antiporter